MKNLDSRSRSRSRSGNSFMTSTQTLVIFLAKSLPNPAIDYTLYLDNLFSNNSLVTALEQLDIEIMRTV